MFLATSVQFCSSIFFLLLLQWTIKFFVLFVLFLVISYVLEIAIQFQEDVKNQDFICTKNEEIPCISDVVGYIFNKWNILMIGCLRNSLHFEIVVQCITTFNVALNVLLS